MSIPIIALAMTGAIRKVLMEHPEKFDPRDYLKPAREAMKQVCIDRMIAFGQAGNGAKLRSALGAPLLPSVAFD